MVYKTAPEMLRALRLRATPQRLAVVTALMRRSRPSSVEELVRASKNAFDVATAYRTLDVLAAGRVVRKLRINDERALYELADDHHHHAVCTSCGGISDISMCVPDDLPKKVKRVSGFSRIDSHTLEFFGLCASCEKAS